MIKLVFEILNKFRKDKKMIKSVTYILIIVLVACTKSSSNQTLSTSSSTTINKSVQNDKTYETCEELISSLVRSSNTVALTNFENVQIRIDTITTEKITVELYVSNDISDDPSIKRIAENPVGWIEFFPSTKKLLDITNDPDDPVLLTYNSRILENADLFALCGFKKLKRK